MRFFAALAVAAGAPDGDRGTGRGSATMRPVRAGAVRAAACRRRSRCSASTSASTTSRRRSPTRTSAPSTARATASPPGIARDARCRAGRCATRSSARPSASPGRGSARVRAAAAELMDPAHHAGAGGARSPRPTPRSSGSPATCTAARRAAPTRRCACSTSWPTARDCAARRSSTTRSSCILPTQNPDGREADTRRNAYGFDMNRDWFARTQPETDGKLELLRRYPPVLFIDAHEMGSTALLLPAQRRPDLPRDHRRVGRLDQRPLRPGDAATSSTRAGSRTSTTRRLRPLLHGLRRHGARRPGSARAGMTFEKTDGDPTARARLRAVRHAVDLAVRGRRAQGRRSSTGWHAPWGEARDQGARRRARAQRGRAARERASSTRCRTSRCGTTSCAPTSPRRRARCRRSCRRLQRMDVEVQRLTAPLTVPDYTPYGARRAGDDAAGRHLLGPDGPAPEALGAGDAQRGHLHAVPVLLRRDGVEPAAAVQRRRRLLRRGARADRDGAGAAARRTRASRRCRPTRRPSRCTRCRRQFVRGIESLGLAALAARPLGPPLPRRDRGGHRCRRAGRHRRPARARRLRDGPGRHDDPRLRPGPRRPLASATGSRPAGATSAGTTAPCSPRRLGVSSATFTRADLGDLPPGSLFRIASTSGSPLGDGRRPVRVGLLRLRLRHARATRRRGRRCASRRPTARTSSSRASPTGEEALGGTAAVIDEPVGAGRSSRSASSRTSARSPTARSGCCATRSSGSDPAVAGIASVRARSAARTRARRSRARCARALAARLVVAARGERAARRVPAPRGACATGSCGRPAHDAPDRARGPAAATSCRGRATSRRPLRRARRAGRDVPRAVSTAPGPAPCEPDPRSGPLDEDQLRRRRRLPHRLERRVLVGRVPGARGVRVGELHHDASLPRPRALEHLDGAAARDQPPAVVGHGIRVAAAILL